MEHSPVPYLDYPDWKDTKSLIHRFLQIAGKVKLHWTPYRNHWWHVPFYVSPRGLSSHSIFVGDARCFDMEFDFFNHGLTIRDSHGSLRTVPMERQSVAAFYRGLMEALKSIGLPTHINDKPFDLKPGTPFSQDEATGVYDKTAVSRYHQMLMFAQQTFEEFAGNFTGKQSPIHLFWHTLDLALTRFSGRPAPSLPEADPVTREAYSREVISCGFWPGDGNYPHAAFYSYTWPEPEELAERELRPRDGFWQPTGRGHLALLPLSEVVETEEPRRTVLAFLESSYEAGADLLGWDREQLERNLAFAAPIEHGA